MATPIKWGPEFLVNTTTNSDQSMPSIAALTNGRFVVTYWDASGNAPDFSGVNTRAQIFNADGSFFGAEFLVNTPRNLGQFDAQVTALSNGRFAVTYVDLSVGATGLDPADVRVQVFKVDGTKSGPEFIAPFASGTSQSDPVIAGLSQGRYVVAWLDYTQSTTQINSIRAQTFNADGTKFGAEHQINTDPGGFVSAARVTGLTDGDFVVSWNSQSASPTGVPIYSVNAQLYHANGVAVGSEYVGNTVAAFGAGQVGPDVTDLAGGGYVISWTDIVNNDNNISCQVFDASGTPMGTKIFVNATTINAQTESSIAGLAGGGFVIAWTDQGLWDGVSFKPDIRAQAYFANGTANGAEFVVNTITTSLQREPSVTGLADGRFVVSWSDLSGAGADTTFAVRAQIFDARAHAINLTGTAGSDSYVGTKFNDTLAGLNGDDVLKGGMGADKITGGLGHDVLTGGGGADVFIYTSAAEAGTGNARDRITDFTAGVDHINVHAFMAGGHFIGSGAFVAGDGPQLRFTAGNGLVQGDVTGDGVADFSIRLDGGPLITATDFIF